METGFHYIEKKSSKRGACDSAKNCEHTFQMPFNYELCVRTCVDVCVCVRACTLCSCVHECIVCVCVCVNSYPIYLSTTNEHNRTKACV